MAHPEVEVFAALGDVEDGVGDELAWGVIGDVAAAICWLDLYFSFEVPLAGVEQVLFVETGSEGENGRVLDEDKRVLSTFLDLSDVLFLHLVRLAIAHAPKVNNVETRHFVCSLMQGTFEL